MNLLVGDCVEVMAEMPADSVDAIVTDPPYGLEFMGKEWDRLDTRQPDDPTFHRSGVGPFDRAKVRHSSAASYGGNAGRGMQAFHERWAREAFRVLKPGGHLLAFGGTRTYHRMVCAIEDAGFEIRDSVHWVYGSGFPKSLDVSKQIDKMAPRRGMFDDFAAHFRECLEASSKTQKEVAILFPSKTGGMTGCVWNWANAANVPTREQWAILQPLLQLSEEWTPLIERIEAEREVVGKGRAAIGIPGNSPPEQQKQVDITAPATEAAQQWHGWGTSLKPAHEPICVARKPLSEKNVAQNVLKHGTGALNIDESRVGLTNYDKNEYIPNRVGYKDGIDHRSTETIGYGTSKEGTSVQVIKPGGRWPPNLLLSHHPDCKPTGEVRRVKGSQLDHVCTSESESGIYQPMNPLHKKGHTDPDGTEPQEVWECVEGCPVRLLDEQSGQSKDTAHKRGGIGDATFKGTYNSGKLYENTVEKFGGYADQGGASRFFPRFEPEVSLEAPFRYVAKSSRRERSAGLEGMPEKRAGVGFGVAETDEYFEFVHSAPEGVGVWLKRHRIENGLSIKDVARHFPSRTGGLTGCVSNWENEFNRPTPEQWWKLKEILGFDNQYDAAMTERHLVPRPQGWQEKNPNHPKSNPHPTVKPIALMRWLVRLVTPPGGTVLDPFMGSGSTGCAAALEGFDFIGIEMDAEYAEIARRRIAHHQKQREEAPLTLEV